MTRVLDKELNISKRGKEKKMSKEEMSFESERIAFADVLF